MAVTIVETVKRYLGWCPNTQVQTRAMTIRPDDTFDTPSPRKSFKIRATNWLYLFRNQTLLLAIWFSGIGMWLSIAIGGSDASMFFIGVVAGTLLSVFQCIRFWKTMNEVREQGPVLLVSLYDKTTIAIITLSFIIPMAVSMNVIPGIDSLRYNSITGGLIFILFWWMLLVVWAWESRTACHLQSDGMMLELARVS